MQTSLSTLACAAVAVLASANAGALNLVQNGEFDTNRAGWENLTPEKQWDPFDDTGDPASGSLRIDNSLAAGFGQFVRQCVSVEPSADYVFGYTHYSEGINADGRADVRLYWQTAAACAGTSAGFELANSSTSSQWTRVETDVVAPADALSVWVQLNAVKLVGGVGSSWRVYFDHVELPEPGGASGAAAAVLALLVRAQRRRASETCHGSVA